MRAKAAAEADVAAAIDAFFNALAAGRLEEAMAAFAPVADVALYGSEISEAMVGHAALRAFFERLYANGHGPQFTFGERRLSVRGNVAWFTAEGSVSAGETVVAPYRVTGILEERGGRWLWALFNGSEPRPDR